MNLSLDRSAHKLIDALASLGLNAEQYFTMPDLEAETARLKKDVLQAYHTLARKLHANSFYSFPKPLQGTLQEYAQQLMHPLQEWKSVIDEASPEELHAYVRKLKTYSSKSRTELTPAEPFVKLRDILEKIMDGVPVPAEKTEELEKLLAQAQEANQTLRGEYDAANAKLGALEKELAHEQKKNGALEQKYAAQEAELVAQGKKGENVQGKYSELEQKCADSQAELCRQKPAQSPQYWPALAAGALGLALVGIGIAHFSKTHSFESRAHNSGTWTSFDETAAEARVHFTDGHTLRFSPSLYSQVNHALKKTQGETLLLEAAKKDGEPTVITYRELAENGLLQP